LYQLNGNTYYFVGESLIVPFRLHRVYLSSHILLGLVLLTLKGRTWAPPAWRVIWQIFLGTMVMLLASRTTTIILALLVLAASGWLFFRAKRVLALGVAGMFVLALGGVLLNDMSRNIFFSTSLFRTDWGRPQDVGPYDGGLTRHFIWQAVQTVEAKMPWYGYGTGTAREVLTQEYERMQFNIAIPGKMNAHNQYFETMLDLGYPGLALLLTLLGAGLWVGYKHNRLLGVFAFIVAMLFLTESHLEAQKGAVFITFMYALIGSTPKGSPDEAEESPSA
jgi:O-antigen ligase